MVFYFTGTGNSLYAAKTLDKDYRSIAQAIHENQWYRAEHIGVVCPVYGHEMPELVKKFLAEAAWETEYFYLVLTYGNRHGGAAELAEDYLETIGRHADYIATLKMADNFLPAFDMNEQIAMDPDKKVDENLAQIKDDIEHERVWHQPVTEADREWHREFLRYRAKAIARTGEDFYEVTDRCIGCGICTRVCPVGCITRKDQRAIYEHAPAEQREKQNRGAEADSLSCQLCMACVHNCPKNAIRLRVPEKNPEARYRNPHIRLMEIVTANDQKNRIQG